MAYTVRNKKHGRVFYLHSRRQALRGGHVQTLYFFAAQEKEGAIEAMPPGYVVYENANTGTLFLKKEQVVAAG